MLKLLDFQVFFSIFVRDKTSKITIHINLKQNKMSEQKSALAAMLEQYESNSKPKYEKKSEKVYDL